MQTYVHYIQFRVDIIIKTSYSYWLIIYFFRATLQRVIKMLAVNTDISFTLYQVLTETGIKNN